MKHLVLSLNSCGLFCTPLKRQTTHLQKLKKLILIMKLVAVLLLVTCIQVSASVYSQSLSLSKKNASLRELFNEIQKQTGYNFLYSNETINDTKTFTVNFKKAKIDYVLNSLLADLPLEYSIEEGIILIVNKEVKSPVTPAKADPIIITGKITDEKDEPLPGVTVRLKGTSIGTSANADGVYFLKIPEMKGTLVFNFVGYLTEERAIRSEKTIDVKLRPDSTALQDVVIVGYGVQKKITTIGAQSSINVESLKQPVANLSNAIAGRVAGVIGVQRSGEPGYDGSQIYIRGISTFTSSSPLVLVDGVERAFSNIDPEDIANFTVLKDASATAVYGVRGANGVILIETKKGRAGKPKVNLQINQGVTQFTKIPEFADGVTYLQIANEAYHNSNPTAIPLYSEEKILATASGSDPDLHPNVNWMKEMFNDFGQNRRVNLNANGGSDRATYYLSVGYYDENGLYKTDELAQYNSAIKFTRYNFTSNLTLKLFRDTKVDFGASGWISDGNYPGRSASSIWNAAYIMPPTVIPVRYSNGSIPQPRGEESNPYDMLTQSGYVNNVTSQLWSNIKVTQDLGPWLKGLSIYGMFSFDNNNYHQISRTKTVDTYFASKRDDYGNLVFDQTRVGSSYLGYDRSNGGSRQFYTEAAVNYSNSFGDKKHDVSAMLLYNQSDRTDAFSNDFINAIPYRYQGIAARTTYAYDNRYLAEFNLGYNGSETFNTGKRFGFFPSYGIGWVTSNEKFFKSLANSIQFLKFRGSYGIVGNSSLGGRRFAYISTVASRTGYSFGRNTDNNFGGLDIGEYAVNVTWEQAKKANVGLELRTLKEALSLTLDLFMEKREGIFKPRGDVPNYAGIQATPFGNLGAVQNKGFDGTLVFNKQLSNDFSLELRGNMVWNRAIIKEDANALWPYPWQQVIGRKLGQRFGKTALGLFESEEEIANSPTQTGSIKPGDIKYKDLNGDGKIDNYDEGPVGYGSIPEIVYGFGPSFTYKGWSLGAWFKGISNVDISLNGEGLQPFQKEGTRGNLFSNITDRWTPDGSNPDPWYPRLTYPSTSNSNYDNSTWWIKNGAFMRLQNVELSYAFPKKSWLEKFGMSNFRVYAVGYNLLTFSSFKLWDVELGDGKGAQYPLMKTYSVGIDCRF
ncbi:SusC/RagA family TonB-linked outer membrane protein [Arcticibacter tournemirensis]|uniref:SusC/RagA family TonB-linked outer membrane protein n=2 Tax=Arcticibacter tournemirensis TaxID=699437 RepID=A0A4Q0M4U1_9SPHI|nr:SusC/RagA family TonB-linked outer membrane protein [Arcticibacter tournemirensis]